MARNQHEQPIQPEREAALAERYDIDPEAFPIFGLQGSLDHDEQELFRDINLVAQRYVEKVDRVIGIADGSIETRERVDPDSPERSLQVPDSIIYLDKSARPVAWMMDAFWNQIAADGVDQPDKEFLNIDRLDWFSRTGAEIKDNDTEMGPADFDIRKVSQESIDRLRAYFTEGELTEDGWQDEVWSLPTRLDGKNVLIMDEVINQGATLAIAQQVLKRAIPEAVISADVFWHRPGRTSVNPKSGKSQLQSSPVWYDKESSWGRGIGDTSQSYYDRIYEQEPTQENLRNKISGENISAPHHDPLTYEIIEDTKAIQLQKEMNTMAGLLEAGVIPRRPSTDRDRDELLDIYKQQNLQPREAVYIASGALAKARQRRKISA